MKGSFLLVAILLPATVLAAWHVGRRGRPLPLMATDAAWAPAASSRPWKCVVIHHSASDAGGAARFAQSHRERGMDELGYHFVIGNGSDTADGEIEVGPRWSAQTPGAHCNTPDDYYNEFGIGVCLVGDFDRHSPSPAQVQALRRLVRFLCDRYAIPADHVLVHGAVTGKTRCPGEHFDLRRIVSAVR